MNHSNILPESLEAESVASAVLPPARAMYWSVQRELWENRSIYIAPLAAAGLFLFGFLISVINLPSKMRGLSTLDPTHQRAAIAMPYDMAAGLLMLTAMVVGVFYCLDALQGECRDRSILFWKSLPVSDRTTVVAKASIPLVVLPLLTFAITFALQAMMLLISSAVLWSSGLNVDEYWKQLSFFRMSVLLLYHLFTVHALWHAPIYGWLLLVSAWAQRAAFLWAILPLLAIGAVEKMVFNTSHLVDVLQYRLTGGGLEAFTVPGSLPMNPMTHPTPGQFLISPGLWMGLAVTAVCVATAVRLRHYRGPDLVHHR
jgi:ABC-2 type transport system permease protein